MKALKDIDTAATIAMLRAQLAERDEEILQLKAAGAPLLVLPHCISLLPQEAQLLGALFARPGQYVPRQAVVPFIDRPRGGDPDPRNIDVLAFRLRKKLAKYTISIASIRGRGYSIPPDSLRRLRALIASEERVAA